MKVDGFKKFIFSGAIILLFAPLFVFGQENQAILKEKQTLDILSIIRKYPLTETQRDFYDQSLYYPSSDFPVKTGAVMLTKQTILQSELDYWLVKMPVEFSKRFIKAVYKLLPLVAYGDFSGAVDLIEQYTVEQANKYINDWLIENQALIGSGIGKYDLVSFKGNYQAINIPYIIVYLPIDANKAKIVAEFYSQKAIEPPESRGSAESNMDWMTKTSWPKDRWLASSYNKNNKIEPFIVRVKGQVVKDNFGNFTWDKFADKPVVEVEFGKPVAQIDQSDVILKTLEANKSQGFLKDKINQIKQKAQGIVDLVKNFFSIFNFSKPQAQISDFTLLEQWQEGLDDLADKGKEIAQHTEEIVTQENVTSVEQMVDTMQQTVEDIVLIATSTPTTSQEQPLPTSQATATELCLSSAQQESAFNKVIFNEIAWMGNTKSSNNEWIELKNISVNAVDLNGWQIFNKNQSIKIIFSTTTIIMPGEFFLAERTNDDSVLNIKADYIYKGALANIDEAIYLTDQNCILQDKIKASSYWAEGDNFTKETMERNQFYGWQTSSVVGGTPRAVNSVGKTKPTTGGGGSNYSQTESVSAEPATTTQQKALTVEKPQVLIVEIQVRDSSSTQNDFIKLFNYSTTTIVDLSGWQLKKKNNNGNEESIKKFTGNQYLIEPQSYFLWMNSTYELTTTTKPNATTTQKISENNSIALFNNNDEIIDQLAWGSSTDPFVEGSAFFGNPTESQNLLRKFFVLTGQYQDTNDNSVDFELSTSTITTNNPTSTQQTETAPPIVNLMAVPSTVRGAVDLFWTCPTTAIAYIIKKSEQEITTTTWDLATTITQSILPKVFGQIEFLQVENLDSNKKIYFAIKYTSAYGQVSEVSNNFSAKAWPGFQDNNDGTLTDLRTGLLWFKNASSSTNNFGASSTQDGATEFIANQQTEWRLPNFKELASLFNYKTGSGQIWSDFENMEKKQYWSISKRMINNPGWGTPPRYSGWAFNFETGKTEASFYNEGEISPLYPFVAVKNNGIKGGLLDNDFDFVDNGDKTITDNKTNLMWLDANFILSFSRRDWNGAWNFVSNVALCNDGSLQGDENAVGDCSANGGTKYDDWRMTNVQELMEITKLNNKSGIPTILPNLSGWVSYYWSTTLFDENKAWYVSDGAYYGSVDYLSKTADSFLFQMVREK